MTSEEILSKLPYSKPFLFDEIIKITKNGVEGHFTFDRILIFTRDILGQSGDSGVILTEVMAQIELVSLNLSIKQYNQSNFNIKCY
jgi:3-hydroxyacyl-[acyl-carrier-protein] dehydratase